MVGDSTPAYLFWPHALERMHAYNPDMRLIAIFRDPIERAFSHWSMIRHRRPDTTYDWPETLERYPATELPAELPPDPGPNRFRSEGSVLARGFYGAQLERGFGIFPREQWLLLEFRAMLADFQGTLDRITDHICIRRYRKEQPLRQAMASAEVIYGTAPTADDITALAEGYAADLALFRRLSGLDVSRWPTVQVVAGELDPGDFAAKLARKVRPVEERPTLSAPAAELDAEPAE